MSIVPQNQQDEELFNTISSFFVSFRIGDLLRKCGACKQKGVPALDIFKYKLCNVFAGRSMYMQLRTNSFSERFSKNTYYRVPAKIVCVRNKKKKKDSRMGSLSNSNISLFTDSGYNAGVRFIYNERSYNKHF